MNAEGSDQHDVSNDPTRAGLHLPVVARGAVAGPHPPAAVAAFADAARTLFAAG
jgi:hypothetical protein